MILGKIGNMDTYDKKSVNIKKQLFFRFCAAIEALAPETR